MKKIVKEFLFQLILYIANYWVAFVPFHCVRLAYYRHVCRFKIGRNSSIHMGTRFLSVRRFEMGNNSVINENCVIGNRCKRVGIGDCVVIAPECHLRSGDHDVNDPFFGVRYDEIDIGDYAFIGLRATILKGVKLGKGAVVAAGAIVTKSVPPYEVVAGVPAKKIGERTKDLQYAPVWKPLFH
jgi:acetyltransferase-like isoleucine patch superfamily enzyme